MLVIGLDCADPVLVFERWRDRLPNLSRLMAGGAYGRLRSSDPPITVPAWSSMLSGKDPGQLGFYGFRNRADYSYDNMLIAAGNAMTTPRVWDIAGQHGKQAIVVGVPQTYPVRPMQGCLISCFLTPPGATRYTWPPDLAAEVNTVLAGEEYEVDVRNFRTDDKTRLLQDIYRMTDKRWRLLKHLMQTKPWDLFLAVEMGVDRIHHGFWAFMDPQHRRYQPGNPFEHAIRDYYIHLDEQIGELLALAGSETVVLVVSDHGGKRMDGGFCINEWLIQQGLLVLEEPPSTLSTLDRCRVDWSRTKVWGSGGYYARVYFNVRGREPQGVIPPEVYEDFRNEMIVRLEATTDPLGRPLGTVALKPQALYHEVKNIPPDLIVYFGDLYWRSVGAVGTGTDSHLRERHRPRRLQSRLSRHRHLPRPHPRPRRPDADRAPTPVHRPHHSRSPGRSHSRRHHRPSHPPSLIPNLQLTT